MAFANTASSIIWTCLVFAAILISTIFSLLLNYSPMGFIILMALYTMGYNIYMFVILIIKRKALENDMRFQVADYITLFNILLSACILVMSIVMRSKIKRALCGY